MKQIINPYVVIGLSRPYYLNKYILFSRGIRRYFSILFIFDEIPVVSHLGLYCLPMSQK